MSLFTRVSWLLSAFMSSIFQRVPNKSLHEFAPTSLPLYQYTPVTHGALHALRTELNTVEQAQYRTTTSTSPLSVWRIQPSPPTCTGCEVFVTQRIVPLFGCDCSQKHTCEGITFNLNIDLPTANFPLILILAYVGSFRFLLELYYLAEQ